MEKLPIFNFYQWVVANGGTVRIKDGEFEPVDSLPVDILWYRKGEFTNVELYQKDGKERFVQWVTGTNKFDYYEKQKDVPYEILSLLHSTPESLTLTQICEMLGINRKEGRKAIKQLREKVVKVDHGYTTAKY